MSIAAAQFRAAQANYEAQLPETSDIWDRVDARIRLMPDAELLARAQQFCESSEQLVVETTDGKFVTTRKSVEAIFGDWLAERVAREIEREGRA